MNVLGGFKEVGSSAEKTQPASAPEVSNWFKNLRIVDQVNLTWHIDVYLLMQRCYSLPTSRPPLTALSHCGKPQWKIVGMAFRHFFMHVVCPQVALKPQPSDLQIAAGQLPWWSPRLNSEGVRLAETAADWIRSRVGLQGHSRSLPIDHTAVPFIDKC